MDPPRPWLAIPPPVEHDWFRCPAMIYINEARGVLLLLPHQVFRHMHKLGNHASNVAYLMDVFSSLETFEAFVFHGWRATHPETIYDDLTSRTLPEDRDGSPLHEYQARPAMLKHARELRA